MSRFARFLCVNIRFLKYSLRISCGVSHVCRQLLGVSDGRYKKKSLVWFLPFFPAGESLERQKFRHIGRKSQGSPDRRTHGAAPAKFYVHETILTRHEKAWHLWRWSRDRASHGWLGRSQHGPLHRHKQDAQVCGHCPLPGVQKTNERAAWPPTPPGGQRMTSLRPGLYGFFLIFF